MDSIMDSYWQTPAMSRTFATIAFVLSVSIWAVPILSLDWFFYHPSLVFAFPPQIWRLATSYLVTHPGLGLLFDTYFLYSYMSQLERGHPRFPRQEDLLWYIIFVSQTVLFLNYFTGISTMPYGCFLSALTMAMCYTVTQDQRGMKASIYFITIPAQLMPYGMMAITYLMAGLDPMLLQLHGLVVAHLWDFLTRIWPEFGGGSNLLPTPAFLTRLVQTPRVFQREYGTAIRPTGASGSTTGAQAGPLPDSWRTRGSGQRLG